MEAWCTQVQAVLRQLLKGYPAPEVVWGNLASQSKSTGQMLRKARTANWSSFVERHMEGGAGLLHRISKEIGVQRYATHASADGVKVASSVAQLQADTIKWQTQWDAASEACQEQHDWERACVPLAEPLTVCRWPNH
jgi:hypothetical protein